MKYLFTILTTAIAIGLAAPRAAGADPAQPAGWKALLIAGDYQEPAFDNAVDAMARKLASFGVPLANMTVLKSAADADVANRENIQAGFESLAAEPDEGCFLYFTSHGMRGKGLVMRRAQSVLSPRALGVLLDRFCGDRPTVVIASGCFSGIFAEGPLVPAVNRTILTAARDDRPSFGCNAHLEYTVFDHCILDSLERGIAWSVVMDRTRACVSGNEFDLRVAEPSEPQISVGSAVTDLRVFAP
jgi:hypothetical protein